MRGCLLVALALVAVGCDAKKPEKQEKSNIRPAAMDGPRAAPPGPAAPKGAAKDTPPAPATAAHVTPGLELTAPQKRQKPGVAKVEAKVGANAGAKVKVVWDVEAQFDHEDVEFSWEVREGGRAIQVVVPDSSGVIVVRALAVVDGEPTADRMARTAVEVDYTPRTGGGKGPPAPGPRPQAPGHVAAPAPPAAPLSDVYFVIDGSEKGDPNVAALVAGVGLRNRLRAAGLTPHVFEAGSAAVSRAGLAQVVADAGGAPCMVLVTAQRQVRRVVKLKPGVTAEGVMAEVARP